jgi:hypothetical protein
MDLLILTVLVIQWFGAIALTMTIGKPRRPVTPGLATFSWLVAVGLTAWYLVVR